VNNSKLKSEARSQFTNYNFVVQTIGPIFIYSSFRTGGTAFLHSFNSVNNAFTLLDPFHQALKDNRNADLENSSNWPSNHPPNYRYFENFFTLGRDNWYSTIPDSKMFVYRNSSESYKQEVSRHLKVLVNLVNEKNLIPVFKFETMKGHASFLRKEFPTAIHIGVVRDPKDQYSSWLEQLSLGNGWFFDKARELIANDKEFFVSGKNYDEKANESVFETYYNALFSLRSELDVCIDLTSESQPLIQDKFTEIKSISEKHLQAVKQALNGLPNRIDLKVKFQRLASRQIELTQQRDELTQQRDELTQQLSAIKSSRIWRLTKPWRIFGDVFKN
jgi:hypothetical protein